MFTAITNGVKITVKTAFQPLYSYAKTSEFVFSYTIKIENLSDFTYQLLRRHWYIFDSIANREEVEGEGVVGQQPVLEPGTSYEYTSGCNLRTPLGKMVGIYQMQRLYDGKFVEVAVPEFTLVAPHLLN